METATIQTMCDGCTRAEARTAEASAKGEGVRYVHLCDRTLYDKACGCEACHPDGSFVMTGRFKIEGEVQYDLAEIIRTDLDVYASLKIESLGYAEWERPMVFIWHLMEQDAAVYFSNGIDDIRQDFEYEDGSRRWDEDRYESLCLACPEARVPDRSSSGE